MIGAPSGSPANVPLIGCAVVVDDDKRVAIERLEAVEVELIQRHVVSPEGLFRRVSRYNNAARSIENARKARAIASGELFVSGAENVQ